MYVNVYSFEIQPEAPNLNSVEVDVAIEDERQKFKAFIYQGGQRLLLPTEARDLIINALFNKESVVISVGKYSGEIISAGFIEKYDSLMNLTIN